MSGKRAAAGRQRVAAPARASSERTERRRQALIRAGIELFGSRSYEAVSIDDLAHAAGISTGLLYHYFAGKRELYVATVRSAAAELLERTAPDPSLPQAERVARSLEAYLDYVEERAASYAGLLRGGLAGDEEIREIVESTREAFVERMLEEIGVGRASLRLRLAVRGWVGFAEAVVLSWIGRREVGRRQVADVLLVAARALLGELEAIGPASTSEPRADPRGAARGRAGTVASARLTRLRRGSGGAGRGRTSGSSPRARPRSSGR